MGSYRLMVYTNCQDCILYQSGECEGTVIGKCPTYAGVEADTDEFDDH